MADGYYTTSTAFLEALAEAGVRYIFANLGSDHPGLIEALAQARAERRAAGAAAAADDFHVSFEPEADLPPAQGGGGPAELAGDTG